MVRQRRRELGLTVRGLAAKVGVTGGQVAHVEKGRSRPSVELRAKLERILAIGNQTHDDEFVLHALGLAPPDADLVLLRDATGRPGIFRERDLADSTSW